MCFVVLVFYLNSLLPTTMSSQTHQNDPTEVEAAIDRLASLPRGPPTPTSLGFYFHWDGVALEGGGHFFAPEKEPEGAELLLKMQNQRGGCILFRTCRSLPKVSGQNSGRQGSRHSLAEKELWELQAPVLSVQTLSSVTSWRTTSGVRR
uniref:Ferritin light chain n=1 Tax=Myotis myotis TaxID=51298 RepID=A0A7J7XZX9_MYOMY|nr:hypothetical protein mMyoMyo1_011324 [Myotis myotis]